MLVLDLPDRILISRPQERDKIICLSEGIGKEFLYEVLKELSYEGLKRRYIKDKGYNYGRRNKVHSRAFK